MSQRLSTVYEFSSQGGSYAGHFLLGFDAVCNRGQIHISIELHVVKSHKAVIFILYCVQNNLLLDRFPRHKTPVDALADHFLTTCSATVLFMPSSSNSSLCFSRTKFCVPNLFNRAIKMTSVLWVHFMYTEQRSQPISYQILHSLHMPVVLVGKFTSGGRAFYSALAFLHYVAIDLNPGANRTIGIPPFVGPLGYVMQPSNRGQHILLQECPNSLRHFFLQTSLFSYVYLTHYLMICHLQTSFTARAEELLWEMFYKEGEQSRGPILILERYSIVSFTITIAKLQVPRLLAVVTRSSYSFPSATSSTVQCLTQLQLFACPWHPHQ